MADYIFPNFIARALRTPSAKTQAEANLVGITCMLLASWATGIYLLFFARVGWAYGSLIIFSDLGVTFFLGSQLITSYIQYYTMKKAMGLYPIDEELQMKIDEAEKIREQINILINKCKEVKND